MNQDEILLQVGVKIFLKNKESKFLLLHRARDKYRGVRGRWDLPGGRIMAGATLLENLRREIKEETNLDLVGEPKLLMAQDILSLPERHVVRLTYLGQATGELVLDKSENDDHHWLAWPDLQTFPDLDVYLGELVKSLNI